MLTGSLTLDFSVLTSNQSFPAFHFCLLEYKSIKLFTSKETSTATSERVEERRLQAINYRFEEALLLNYFYTWNSRAAGHKKYIKTTRKSI